MKLPFKFWWKFYFWIAAASSGTGIYLVVTLDEPLDLVDVADLASWVFSLVGVFGFAFSRRIGGCLLWKVWAPVAVSWDFGRIVFDYTSESEMPDLWLTAFVVLVIGSLMFPQYVALYLYGFRSEGLWKNRDLTTR